MNYRNYIGTNGILAPTKRCELSIAFLVLIVPHSQDNQKYERSANRAE